MSDKISKDRLDEIKKAKQKKLDSKTLIKK